MTHQFVYLPFIEVDRCWRRVRVLAKRKTHSAICCFRFTTSNVSDAFFLTRVQVMRTYAQFTYFPEVVRFLAQTYYCCCSFFFKFVTLYSCISLYDSLNVPNILSSKRLQFSNGTRASKKPTRFLRDLRIKLPQNQLPIWNSF